MDLIECGSRYRVFRLTAYCAMQKDQKLSGSWCLKSQCLGFSITVHDRLSRLDLHGCAGFVKALDVLRDRLDPSAEIRNEVSKFLKGFDVLKGVEIQCCPAQRPARAREFPARRCHANAVASAARL